MALKYIPDELLSQVIRLKPDTGKACSSRVQNFIKEAIEEKLEREIREAHPLKQGLKHEF